MESVTQRRARASPAGSLPELQGRGGGLERTSVLLRPVCHPLTHHRDNRARHESRSRNKYKGRAAGSEGSQEVRKRLEHDPGNPPSGRSHCEVGGVAEAQVRGSETGR